MHKLKAFKSLFLCILAISFLNPCVAQTNWPNKPVRIIVPWAAGGVTDTLARFIANKLTISFKSPFIVENHPGAGGIIGSDLVAKSPVDGYTLVASGMASHVITPNLANTPFDPMKSFTHIANLGGPPLVLVINPDLKIKDVKELIDLSNKQAGGLSYASPGSGTHNHLMGELFKLKTNANLVHISYKGGGPALLDLISGHVQVGFLTLTTAATNIKAGKLKPLAITSQQRMSDYPQVPTFNELGYPSLTTYNWSGLSGPAGLSPAIVARINEEVIKALREKDSRDQLKSEGITDVAEMNPEAFTAFFQKEILQWAPIAKSINTKLGN
jgi:tripartite-type tricarboxylate transporter receptor subunit TctC